ncbi:MAG: hypothetical protein ABIE07_01905 [Candidatus Zixiibacteriota bacterium]
MPKFNKPGPGKCVYCLGEFDKLTWDHVFPKSWYSESEPINKEKWKVPACNDCNKKYGEIEQDLLLRFALCFNPNDERFKNISKKSLKGIRPELGKTPRDINSRKKKKDELKNDIISHDEIPDYGILPNFGMQSNAQYDKLLTIGIHQQSLKSIGEKLIRGIIYQVTKNYITENYSIDTRICDNNDKRIKTTLDDINRVGTKYTYGTSIEVTYAILPDDNISAVSLIWFWQRLFLSVSVIGKELGANHNI